MATGQGEKGDNSHGSKFILEWQVLQLLDNVRSGQLSARLGNHCACHKSNWRDSNPQPAHWQCAVLTN